MRAGERSDSGRFSIDIRGSLNEIFQISVTAVEHCDNRPGLEVTEAQDLFVVFDGSKWDGLPQEDKAGYFPLVRFAKLDGNERAQNSVGDNAPVPTWQLAVPDFLLLSPDLRYRPNSALIEAALDSSKKAAEGRECIPDCDNSNRIEGRWVSWPSGLFNFIERSGKFDAYAYAIFPRQDVIGTLADRSLRASLAVAMDGNAAGQIGSSRAVHEASLSSSMVTVG